MIGQAILLVYIVGFIVAWPAIAQALLHYAALDGEAIEWADRLFASFLGLFLALVWPIMVPVGWMARKLR